MMTKMTMMMTLPTLYRPVLLACALAAPGCVGPECEEKVDIVDMSAWHLLDAASDPFSPPADAALCGAEEVRMEPFGDSGPIALDVDTRRGCGWATVEQETKADLIAGDEIQVRVFYFSQTSFPEAEAELVLALEDEAFWSVVVPIPAQSTLEAPLVPIAQDVPAGTKIRFHVGNHGDNSWNLLELSRTREVYCDAET